MEDPPRRETATKGTLMSAVPAAGSKAEAEAEAAVGWLTAPQARGSRPRWRTGASLRRTGARFGRLRRSKHRVRVVAEQEGKLKDVRSRGTRRRRRRAAVADPRLE